MGSKKEPSDWESYWPLGFLAIVACNGDYILVNCIQGSPTYGEVYEFGKGFGVQHYSHSIERYFDTLCAFVREGAIYIDADGVLDFDVDKEADIRDRMNPSELADGTLGTWENPDWIPQ